MPTNIRSRSNKNIGDILEDKYKILDKIVIAEPFKGDPRNGIAPRHGVYSYEVVETTKTLVNAKRREVRSTTGFAGDVLTLLHGDTSFDAMAIKASAIGLALSTRRAPLMSFRTIGNR